MVPVYPAGQEHVPVEVIQNPPFRQPLRLQPRGLEQYAPVKPLQEQTPLSLILIQVPPFWQAKGPLAKHPKTVLNFFYNIILFLYILLQVAQVLPV